MLFYRAALPLSARTLNYVAGVIRRHRRAIGSCWRKLTPARQALLVLAYLRKGETVPGVDGQFGAQMMGHEPAHHAGDQASNPYTAAIARH